MKREYNEESEPMAQESKDQVSFHIADMDPYIAEPTKSKIMICCTSKKHRSTIPVLIILGFGITLLAIIIVCIAIETIGVKNGMHFWGSKIWRNHNKEDKLYHLSIISYVNNLNTTWKAKYNRFASRAVNTEMTMQEMSELVEKGKMMSEESLLADTVNHIKMLKSYKIRLPQQFDARIRWSLCWSLHQVFNQGGCGSCWAVAAASVMSDRLCISTNYSNQKQISAQDLVSCCTECGGCQGSHWALSTFNYWRTHGIVTGGDYGSFEGCKPYAVPPDCGGPCSFEYYQKKTTPACEYTCHPLYGVTYKDDLISSRKAYWIRAEKGSSEIIPSVQEAVRSAVGNDDPVELIKREIYLYGPILACFTAHEDFQHYDSGIYHTVSSSVSKELYGHCAKLLGWGEESGLKYWLYMNTWGRDWGDFGFFRVNLSELPEEAAAGLL